MNKYVKNVWPQNYDLSFSKMKKLLNDTVSLKGVFALILSVILITSFLSYLAFSPDLSYTTIIQDGSMISEATYIFFVDDSTYYARNGRTGAIQFSGANFATVVDSALNVLPAIESTHIFHITYGTYTVSQRIDVDKNVRFVGEGIDTILILANGVNDLMFNFTQTGAYTFHNTGLEHLRLDGNKANQNAGDALVRFEDVFDVIVRYVWIYQTFKDGIYFEDINQPMVSWCWFEECVKSGETGFAIVLNGSSTQNTQIESNRFFNNYRDIMVDIVVPRTIIARNIFTGSDAGNIEVSGQYVSISDNIFSNPIIGANNTYPVINIYGNSTINAYRVTVNDNTGTGTFSPQGWTPNYFVYVDNYVNQVDIYNNDFKDYGTEFVFVHGSASRVEIRANFLATNNWGTTTLASGSSSINVTVGYLTSNSKIMLAIITASALTAGEFLKVDTLYVADNIFLVTCGDEGTASVNIVFCYEVWD